MADDRMALLETMRKAGAERDADFLRQSVQVLAEAVMEAEVTELTGVPHGVRDPERRQTQRNGYRERRWDTRVGTIDLSIPRVRDGSYLPSLLEPRRRAERALLAVVQEAYVLGVSTRRVEDLVEALGISSMSKSQVSRICAALDAEVEAFRSRSLAGEAYPYLWLDATYVKVREAGRVVNMAALVAIGVSMTGERRVLGIDLAPGHSEGGAWPGFIRSLVERGLSGVGLVISDAHPGLVAAVGEQLLGAAWQRSSVHTRPRDRTVPTRPGGECLGNGDRSRSCGRPAPLSGGEAHTGPREMCPRAPSDERPGRAAPERDMEYIGRAPHMEVFIGIDWGEQHHQVHALDMEGHPRLELRVSHDRAGLEQLHQALSTLGESGSIGIAIERREGLLVEHLLAWGHPVYPVNPKVAARAREGYRAAPIKSDVLDAVALADLLRRQVQAWRPLRQPSEILAELQALVRDRDGFVVEHRRTQHKLRATLLTYYPALPRLFSSLDRAITLAFLRRYPTPDAASRLTVARLARFLKRQGYTGRTAPEVLLSRLLEHPATPSPGTDRARAQTALALADLLEQLGDTIDRYDTLIAELVAHHPDAPIFASLPGTGPVTVATLIAEMGEDRSRFPAPGSLLAEAGLAPVTRQSGSARRVIFRYAANHHLRAIWQQWMLTVIRISPWTRDAYDAARARGQSHSRAVRSVGARWCRILWRCWQDGVPYDPALDRRVQLLEAA